MLHPDVEIRHLHDDIGYGLVATRFIPRGTITWVICALEQVFSSKAFEQLPAAYRPYLDKYAYANSAGDRILCCDLGRFMNHSCDSNTLTLPDSEIEVATRDIQPGDQITDDYGTLRLAEDLQCLCGSPNCRRVVTHDDPQRHLDRWEASVFSAFAEASGVAQPLEAFMPEGLEARLTGIVQERKGVLKLS